MRDCVLLRPTSRSHLQLVESRIPFAALVVLAVGCAESASNAVGDGDSPGAPRVSLIGTIELEQSDTFFVGRPISLAIDALDGTLYVADALNQRVARFGRDGRLVRTYGTPGSGPGEIGLARGVFLADSYVVVTDTRAGTLVLYDRQDGDFQRSVPLIGYTGNVFSTASDTAWIGVRDPTTGTVITGWAVDTDSLVHVGQIPDEFEEYPQIARAQGLPVVSWADSLLVGFGLLNTVFLYSKAGSVLDTIPIPVRYRRGNSKESFERADGSAVKLANSTSALWGMHKMPSGDVALVHYDLTVEERGDRPRIRNTTVYLSVLRNDLATACVDRRVAVESDAQPVIQFLGDTLFMVRQRVENESASLFMSIWQIDTGPCSWVRVPVG